MPALLLAFLLCARAASAPAPVVLTRAYAHNDYEHPRALFDALDRGFFAVEADVHLRGRELFVAHTGSGITSGRTLRSLYLDPLLDRVRRNKGRVYPGGPKGFLLMVEFKSNGNDSYPVLREMLRPYHEMLTSFTPDKIAEGAVTVVITGHRPNGLLASEALRYAGIDGDLGDLDKSDKTLFPVISDPWAALVPVGGIPRRFDEALLRDYVRQAHARGRKIRFYDTPDDEEAWALLYAAGVDYINTDDLEGLKKFLLKHVA